MSDPNHNQLAAREPVYQYVPGVIFHYDMLTSGRCPTCSDNPVGTVARHVVRPHARVVTLELGSSPQKSSHAAISKARPLALP